MILWQERTRVNGSQGNLVHIVAHCRPASKGEKEKIMALDRSAAPGYQNMMEDASIKG